MKVRSALIKLVGLLFSSLLVMSLACGLPEVLEPPPRPTETARHLVEERLPILDEAMIGQMRGVALQNALSELVESEASRPFAARVDGGLRYSTVFQREYIAGGVEPFLADETGLTSQGSIVLAIVEDSRRHGIDPEPFHIDRIRHISAELAEMEFAADDALHLTPEEVEELVEVVAEVVEREGEERAEELLWEIIGTLEFEEGQPEILRRLGHFNNGAMERFEERARLIAELELWTADGALRYAREMRHANLERVDWRQMRDAGGSTEVILGRMQRTLNDLVAAEEGEVEEVFRKLEPSHWQYRALLEATDRYRTFAENGDWQRIRSFTVELGAASDRVAELRNRLEAEGFVARPDEPDEDFDERVVDAWLIEAIEDYQSTHQMTVNGRPSAGFWRSINISAADRVAQMELNLQRWRESRLEDDESFIMVNIPDFHTEVWLSGERKMRFPVVVGRNNRRCDADVNQWDYPNATPKLISMMDHIIINPAWYVPPRLVRESLEPRLEENPDYFEEQGYEEITLADGRKVIRQSPGPQNALGRVKFMFPNEHNVYLHDTPQQEFFDYTIRAYSFGCVRVSEPLDLARTLLEWDGHDHIDVDEVIESGRTRQVNLETELPVITEYYTVWVDDEGRPHFLADVYRLDARRFSEDPEEFDQCRPRAAAPEPELDVGEEAPEALDEDLGP